MIRRLRLVPPCAAAFVLVLLALAPAARAADPTLPPLALPREADPGFPDADTRRMQLGLTRADRIQHASLSLALGLSVGLTSREPIAAAGSALAFGLAKELWDMRVGRGFDGWDFFADALGAGAAAGATAALQDQE